MDKNENTLLDLICEKLEAKNDAALSRELHVAPPVISKIRHKRLPIGAALLLIIHEVTNLSIRDLKEYITWGPQVTSLQKLQVA